MKLFDVYNRFDISPVKAKGCYLWDRKGNEYLDLYGGHAVISIGHSHPYYIKMLCGQLHKIGFYSNSVQLPLQEQVADLLGEISAYEDYQLFMCNSGAEANENAMKLASFYNQKKKVLAFRHAFHGRTSAAVAATDNPKIMAPVNKTDNVVFSDFNDEKGLEKAFEAHQISSVIVEGIQGVGGVQIPTGSFLKKIETLCQENGAVFIADEIQSGYGRTGEFFAHQYSGVKPDIITTAKGMGNGFPVAGVLISPKIKPHKGMLGTTFGGNYLACTAALAVLEILKSENLLENARKMGTYLVEKLSGLPKIKEIRGRGLMIGLQLEMPCAGLRKSLLENHLILTGNAAQENTLRILPALTVSEKEIDRFVNSLKIELNG